MTELFCLDCFYKGLPDTHGRCARCGSEALAHPESYHGTTIRELEKLVERCQRES